MYVYICMISGRNKIHMGDNSIGVGSELQGGIHAYRRRFVYDDSTKGEEGDLARGTPQKLLQKQGSWKACAHH